MSTVLITGVSGFVGSHLAEYLVKKHSMRVIGLARRRGRVDNLEDAGLFSCDSFQLEMGDVTDPYSVEGIIIKHKPSIIFHLAAQSFVPLSWKQPLETFRTNVEGTINVLEAVRKHVPDATVQIAGSSEEYGLVYPSEAPVPETNPLRPMSPYGVSKVAADYLGYQYHLSYGLNVVRTRAFNHTGPRRGEEFVVSSFCQQALKVKAEVQKEISVGNLSALRDFTDVRDMVRAYYLAATSELDSGPWNIATGKARTIRSVLELIIAKTGLFSDCIVEDESRMRPSDVPILRGDSTKFRVATGWAPKIPFEETVEDTLEWWRKKLGIA